MASIDITGLNKKEVLRELWKRSKPAAFFSMQGLSPRASLARLFRQRASANPPVDPRREPLFEAGRVIKDIMKSWPHGEHYETPFIREFVRKTDYGVTVTVEPPFMQMCRDFVEGDPRFASVRAAGFVVMEYEQLGEEKLSGLVLEVERKL